MKNNILWLWCLLLIPLFIIACDDTKIFSIPLGAVSSSTLSASITPLYPNSSVSLNGSCGVWSNETINVTGRWYNQSINYSNLSQNLVSSDWSNFTLSSATNVTASFILGEGNTSVNETWWLYCMFNSTSLNDTKTSSVWVYEGANVSVSYCSGVSSLFVQANMTYFNRTSGVLSQPETLVMGSSTCTFNVSNYGANVGIVFFRMNQTNSSYVFRCDNKTMSTGWVNVVNVSSGGSGLFNCTGEYVNATKSLIFDFNYTVNST